MLITRVGFLKLVVHSQHPLQQDTSSPEMAGIFLHLLCSNENPQDGPLLCVCVMYAMPRLMPWLLTRPRL
jgi:hypothetical protein